MSDGYQGGCGLNACSNCKEEKKNSNWLNIWIVVLKDGTLIEAEGLIREIVAMYSDDQILSLTRLQ